MRVIATAGHVDHGKSSLVRALTGTDPDRWAEEKRRGLTIDLGFAHTTLPSGDDLSIVDVPGHVRFLSNMLAGVGGVDACLFVVAATEGWKPQSEEHLRILELLGIGSGVVALTKCDLVDQEWVELQALEIGDRLAGTFLANAPMVPVSATTGIGLEALQHELAALVQRTPAAVDQHRPRLWIDRVFAAKGSGTVVTGTLTGGAIQLDMRMQAGPHEVRVRGIQTHGVSVNSIAPGHRVALNLAGVEHHQLRRGDAVIDPRQWRPTTRVDASLTVLGSLDHVVSRRGAYVAYIGSGEHPVRVRVLSAPSIAPGATGTVRLHLTTEVPLVMGDRFVLRESGRSETIGGGVILDVQPVRPASRARPDHDVERIIAEHGWIDTEHLMALTGARRTPAVGDWVVDADTLERSTAELRRRLDEAGIHGIDTAVLHEHERALLTLLPDVEVHQGVARQGAAVDPWSTHSFLEVARVGGFAPPDPAGVDRNDLRELVRRALLIEREGIFWHHQAITDAALASARLLINHPNGFTMSQFREALGVSRKYSVPLATELDARGITRRRNDVRIGGPRLPAV